MLVENRSSPNVRSMQRHRPELAHFLIDSIDDSMDEDAEAVWEDELARRTAEIRSGKVQGKPVEQVFAELLEKRS
jgi:putative addiction module component (TIGR02574 family)